MGKYGKEVFERIIELKDKGKAWPTILSALKASGLVASNLNTGHIAQMYQHGLIKYSGEPKTEAQAQKEFSLAVESSYQKAVEELNAVIGRTHAVKRKSVVPKSRNVILTISDTHVPYHDKEKIARAARDSGANICVLAGDFLNGGAISDHVKVLHEDFQTELGEAAAFVEWLSKIFDVVWILDGNHDEDRWNRQIGKSVRPDVANFILSNLNPIDFVIRGLGNVFRAKSSHEGNPLAKEYAKELGHTLIIGDCMWSHLTLTGRDGKSVRGVQNWFNKFRPLFKWPECRVFQQGHTHQLSANFDHDSVVIQTGCMVKMDGLVYSLASHGKSSPPVWGYTVIEQVDGVTDLGSIKVVKL